MPVAYIPNGSGNDTLRSLNVFDVDRALDYIVKGDIIKTDITKFVIDYEDEASVPKDKRNDNIRY
jgi:diacylglycerol kinase family enzyme